jgi:WhiB family redox-sensing transcriptional regulator
LAEVEETLLVPPQEQPSQLEPTDVLEYDVVGVLDTALDAYATHGASLKSVINDLRFRLRPMKWCAGFARLRQPYVTAYDQLMALGASASSRDKFTPPENAVALWRYYLSHRAIDPSALNPVQEVVSRLPDYVVFPDLPASPSIAASRAGDTGLYVHEASAKGLPDVREAQVSGAVAGAHDLLDAFTSNEPDEPEDLSWQKRALCAQTDPEAFFPEKGGSTREAKRVCLACEVRAECLDYAMRHDESFGIWGGLSERERRRVKKQAI